MEKMMTQELTQADRYNLATPKDPVNTPKKKKVTWLRTILWMFSMMLLANVAMGVVAYFLFFYHK